MTVERSNPLPLGVYWQNIPQPKQAEFGAWLREHREHLRVLSTEGGDPSWVLFRVLEPVPWEGPGFPTLGRDGMNQADTVSRPDPETFSGFKWFAAGAVVAVAAIFWTRPVAPRDSDG